jgi:hypothetical protein
MWDVVGLSAYEVDRLPRVAVGPGCTRIDLPGRSGVRLWVVDMEPGAVWPRVDWHDAYGEDVFVVNGEVIEGDHRFGRGSFLRFDAKSFHRPRTETGVRLFGFNLQEPDREAA